MYTTHITTILKKYEIAGSSLRLILFYLKQFHWLITSWILYNSRNCDKVKKLVQALYYVLFRKALLYSFVPVSSEYFGVLLGESLKRSFGK